MVNRQEVEVQTRGPDGGNPTLRRQGRRSGKPGPFRWHDKRRKAREGRSSGSRRCVTVSSTSEAPKRQPHRVSWPPVAKPNFRRRCGCTGDGMATKSVEPYPWRSAGFRASGRRENERTNDRWPCRSRTGAQYQKAFERRSQPRKQFRRGGKAPAAMAAAASSTTPQRRTANSPGRLRWMQTGTYLGLPTMATSSRCGRPGTQSPQRSPSCLRLSALCAHGGAGGLREQSRHQRVVNRPTIGVTTCRPDEPYVNSTSTVL
jgi:hypothetical protein